MSPDRLHDHGRLGRRLRRRVLPPDDARLLQGAALHGAPARSSRRWAASSTIDRMGGFRKAMPFTFGVLRRRRPGARPPSRCISGFFSKDEILASTTASAAAGTTASTSVGYIGALLTVDLHLPDDLPRVLRRRRARRRRELEHGPRRTTPSTRRTRRPARSRTPTSASPAPTTTSPSATWPMRFAMGVLAVLGASSPASSRSAVRDHRVLAELPRADVRGLDRRAPGRPRRPRDVRPRRSARVISLGFIARRLPHLGRRPGPRDGLAGAARRAAPPVREQVVLRRADRPRSIVRPVALVRPLGAATRSSASSSTARSSAAPAGSCAPARPPCARCRPASCAATRCSSSPASPVVAPLLPASRGRVMTIRPAHRPLAPARRRRSLALLVLPRAARRAGCASLGALLTLGLAIVARRRLRHRARRPAVRHRRDVDRRARHPLQARRRRAERRSCC